MGTPINLLTALDELAAADALVVYSSSNGDARRASLTTLLSFLEDNQNLAARPFYTQYSAPAAGNTVQVAASFSDADGSENVHLILTPAGTLATLTIKLPLSSACVDAQEIIVNCTQIVTTLSWDANGASDIVGEPATLAANAFLRLKYDELTTNWYRIG
jgi:hypothetical protein